MLTDPRVADLLAAGEAQGAPLSILGAGPIWGRCAACGFMHRHWSRHWSRR
jgi:hypothetical protein